MNAIVPFQFEQQAVRVVERAGDPWFILADVCRVLGIANVGGAAARLDDDERDDIRITDAIGREQAIAAVNESGLWSLVLTSRKPAAKAFKRWVTAEVLPAIRKTGRYGAPAAELNLSDPATLHRLLIDYTTRAMVIDERVAELAPKAAALERLTAAEGNLCITDAAKALSMAPRRLFEHLEREGWIYRRPGGSHWVGYQQRIQAGVITHRVTRIEGNSGPRFVEQVLITPRGMAKLASASPGGETVSR